MLRASQSLKLDNDDDIRERHNWYDDVCISEIRCLPLAVKFLGQI